MGTTPRTSCNASRHGSGRTVLTSTRSRRFGRRAGASLSVSWRTVSRYRVCCCVWGVHVCVRERARRVPGQAPSPPALFLSPGTRAWLCDTIMKAVSSLPAFFACVPPPFRVRACSLHVCVRAHLSPSFSLCGSCTHSNMRMVRTHIRARMPQSTPQTQTPSSEHLHTDTVSVYTPSIPFICTACVHHRSSHASTTTTHPPTHPPSRTRRETSSFKWPTRCS